MQESLPKAGYGSIFWGVIREILPSPAEVTRKLSVFMAGLAAVSMNPIYTAENYANALQANTTATACVWIAHTGRTGRKPGPTRASRVDPAPILNSGADAEALTLVRVLVVDHAGRARSSQDALVTAYTMITVALHVMLENLVVEASIGVVPERAEHVMQDNTFPLLAMQ
jgi:hypothetical protein